MYQTLCLVLYMNYLIQSAHSYHCHFTDEKIQA